MYAMLNRYCVDVILYERWQWLQRAKDTRVDVLVYEPPLASAYVYMFVHKKHAHLAPKMAQVLADMKADGTYQKNYDQSLTALIK